MWAVQIDSGRLIRCYIAGTTGSVSKARIYCRKPSGKETYTEGTAMNNSCILFGLTEQMLAETGEAVCQLHLVDTENVLTSFDFLLEVKENRIAGSQITSTDEYQALVALLNRLEKFDPIEITEFEIDSLESGSVSGGSIALNVQKIYASVGQMNAGFATDGLPENAIVMISTGNPNDADNAKVYRKGVNGYEYMVDLSGATGPKGDKGDPGEKRRFGGRMEQGLRSLVLIQRRMSYTRNIQPEMSENLIWSAGICMYGIRRPESGKM